MITETLPPQHTSSDILTAEANYRALRQVRTELVDAMIDRYTEEQDAWYFVRPIVQWNQTKDEVISGAQEDDIPSSRIDVAKHILDTGEWDNTRIDLDDVTYGVRPEEKTVDDINHIDLTSVKTALNRRLFYAHLAMESPETFTALRAHDIVGLHGTNAIVLPDIVAANGLLAHALHAQRGIVTGSGEVHPAPVRRDFVSFGSTNRLTAFSYSDRDLRSAQEVRQMQYNGHLYQGYTLRLNEIKTYEENLKQRIIAGDSYLEYADHHRFGITFGLARKALWSAGIVPAIGKRVDAHSSIDETTFDNYVGLDYMPIVLTNEVHVEQVSTIVPSSVTVIAREAMERAMDVKYAW